MGKVALESGLVNLVDERLTLAEQRLQYLLIRDSPGATTPETTVARMGLAWAEHRRCRFQAADENLTTAIRQAKKLGLVTVLTIGVVMQLQNQSDMGGSSEKLLESLSQVTRPSPKVAPENVAGIRNAIEWYCLLVNARLFYRCGQQRAALDLLNNFLLSLSEEEAAQSPIILGSIQRMRGILYTFSGNPEAARDDIRAAQERFERIGYAPGIIRCTQSMARSSLFLDREETERELQRARLLIDEHEPGYFPREMESERAVLESNMGDLFFAKGEFARALECYQNDYARTISLGSPQRATAHIMHNIGRAYTALGRFDAAAESLRDSKRLFEEASDAFNAIRAALHLVLAQVEAGAFEEARRGLIVIHNSLAGPGADYTEQPKQEAMLHILSALIEVRYSTDLHQATARLNYVKEILTPFGNDAYFIRALMVEAEVEVARSQNETAAALLTKAERLADAFYTTDLKRYGAELRNRLGLTGMRGNLSGSIHDQCKQSVISRVPVTVALLVVELRGYTAFTEEVSARSMPLLAELLAEWTEAMLACAERYDGELVRFYGDSLLVAFEDRTLVKEIKAVQSALKMAPRFRDIRARWICDRRVVRNVSRQLGLGLGIASGPAVAGHFGHATFQDFAIIGGAVNQAFSLARGGSDGQLLVSRKTARILQEHWPSVISTPTEVSEGYRVIQCDEINTERFYYPLPSIGGLG